MISPCCLLLLHESGGSMKMDPRTSPGRGQPPSYSLQRYTAVPVPPPDEPIPPVENHSCDRKTPGPDRRRRTCMTACWMNRSSTVGMPSLRSSPSGFGISTRFTGFGLYVPLISCSRMAVQCCFRWSSSWLTVIPSTPGAPLLALTRRNASFKFSRSTISSIVRSVLAWLSGALVVRTDSAPSLPTLRGSPVGEGGEVQIALDVLPHVVVETHDLLASPLVWAFDHRYPSRPICWLRLSVLECLISLSDVMA